MTGSDITDLSGSSPNGYIVFSNGGTIRHRMGGNSNSVSWES